MLQEVWIILFWHKLWWKSLVPCLGFELSGKNGVWGNPRFWPGRIRIWIEIGIRVRIRIQIKKSDFQPNFDWKIKAKAYQDRNSLARRIKLLVFLRLFDLDKKLSLIDLFFDKIKININNRWSNRWLNKTFELKINCNKVL